MVLMTPLSVPGQVTNSPWPIGLIMLREEEAVLEIIKALV